MSYFSAIFFQLSLHSFWDLSSFLKDQNSTCLASKFQLNLKIAAAAAAEHGDAAFCPKKPVLLQRIKFSFFSIFDQTKQIWIFEQKQRSKCVILNFWTKPHQICMSKVPAKEFSQGWSVYQENPLFNLIVSISTSGQEMALEKLVLTFVGRERKQTGHKKEKSFKVWASSDFKTF